MKTKKIQKIEGTGSTPTKTDPKSDSGIKPKPLKQFATNVVNKTADAIETLLNIGETVDSVIPTDKVVDYVTSATNTKLDDKFIEVVRSLADASTKVNRSFGRKAVDYFRNLVIQSEAKFGLEQPKSSKIAKWINSALKKVEDKFGHANNPKWYIVPGEHTELSIPSGYNNTTPVGNANSKVPTIATLHIVDNLNPDQESTTTKSEQIYKLLKGIRGLSSTSYNPSDIAVYRLNVEALLKLYYKICRVTQLAYMYQINRLNLAKTAITQLGFDPDEVDTNLAQYNEVIKLFYNILHDEVPLFPLMWERIKAYSTETLSDTDNAFISTYYQFNYQTIVYSTADGDLHYAYFDPEHTWNYASIYSLRQDMLAAYRSYNSKDLTADMIGAFGSNVVFNDYVKIDPLPRGMKAKHDTLLLNAIKNATLTNIQWLTYQGGDASNTQYHEPKFVTVNKQPFTTLDNWIKNTSMLKLYSEVPLSQNDYTQYEVVYGPSLPGNNNNYVKLLEEQDEAVTGEIIYNRNYSRVITKHKATYSEAECIETTSLHSELVSTDFYLPSRTSADDGTCQINTYIDTFYTALINITYDDGSDRLFNIAHSMDPGVNTINAWSNVDWMPRLSVGVSKPIFPPTIDSPMNILQNTAQLWDVSDIGSWDLLTYQNAVRYMNLALKSIGVKVAGKRIENIANVYGK